MKASALVLHLQEAIANFGDKDVVMVQQTGPDSFAIVKVKDVKRAFLKNNTAVLVIE